MLVHPAGRPSPGHFNPASHFWEAIPTRKNQLTPPRQEFQSTPPIEQEAMLTNAHNLEQQTKVSIHASHFWEAMLRYAGFFRRRWCFNPRLPFLGGDAIYGEIFIIASNVSIHASHFWEAMLERICLYQEQTRFQSTPPISGRRACSTWAILSMRCFNPASHFWEAMPVMVNASNLSIAVSIPPPISGRRCGDAKSVD